MRFEQLGAERASASAFVAVVGVALVMVAGMAYDGGQILAAHASARDFASNAARAGAQEIDLDTLRTSGQAELDPDLAAAAAERYLEAADPSAEGTASVSGDQISVSVALRQPMVILPMTERTVVATESAKAVTSDATSS